MYRWVTFSLSYTCYICYILVFYYIFFNQPIAGLFIFYNDQNKKIRVIIMLTLSLLEVISLRVLGPNV